MSELIYVSKDLYSSRRRARSSCARCGGRANGNSSQQPSPGRGAWLASEKGRNLSMEIDGRQSRKVERTASQSGERSSRPTVRDPNSYFGRSNRAAAASGSTYKSDFQSPTTDRPSRSRRMTPSTPSPSSSIRYPFATSISVPSSMSASCTVNDHKPASSSTSYSPRNHIPPRSLTQSQSQTQMPRSQSLQNARPSNLTTYRDHYTWFA